MKFYMKAITLVIIISILFSVFTVNTIAVENEAFTLKKAEDLFHEAFNRLYIVCGLYGELEGDKYFTGKYPEIIAESYLPDFSVRITFNKTTDGIPYSNIDDKFVRNDINYIIVTDERFKTIEKCNKYIKEVLTDDISEAILKDNPHIISAKEDVPCFRLAGEDYIISDSYKAYLPDNFKITADTMLYLTQSYGEAMFRTRFYAAEELNVNGEFATMKIICSQWNNKKFYSTVEFKNTESGWRVSGGNFVDYLTNKITREELFDMRLYGNPDTSDPTPLYIAAIALVSLAAPVVMKRRRREF